MRIRVKDPNGIVKLTRTERTSSFRRAQFQIISNEIGTKQFSVSVRDYGKGWSEYQDVDIDVVESETIARPTITESAPYEVEIGYEKIISFGDSKEKTLTNPNSEYDIEVDTTNLTNNIKIQGYAPGIYKFVLTNQKSVGYVSLNSSKDYDIEASEYIKSEPLEFEVEITKTSDTNERWSLVKISVSPENEIYNFDNAILNDLIKDKIPEGKEPKQAFIRRLKLKCRPKNNNPYVVNPQTQTDLLTNNGYTACIYNITNDEDTTTIDKKLFQEVLLQSGEGWVDYRGNEFEVQDALEIVSKNDETYITQGQQKLELDTYSILEIELYILVGSIESDSETT